MLESHPQVWDGAWVKKFFKPLQVILRCSQGWETPTLGNITLEGFLSGRHVVAIPEATLSHLASCGTQPRVLRYRPEGKDEARSVLSFPGSGQWNSFTTWCKVLQIPSPLEPLVFNSSDQNVWVSPWKYGSQELPVLSDR